MRNITYKTDDVGDTLPASDFNANLRTELQSVVTDAGFTLDPEGGPDTDLDMLGKSLSVYANASQYYADSGSADVYQVNRSSSLQPLEALHDGTIVCFKAANANTGASTLNVDGMGPIDIVNNHGDALIGGEITQNDYITVRYNLSSNSFEIMYPSTGFADNSSLYFGTDRDMRIYHTGSNGYIENGTGWFFIGTSSPSKLQFMTNSVFRWEILDTGHLIPSTAELYDIGSPTVEVRHIYQGNACHHYLGNDNDIDIYHSGNNAAIINNTGNMYIRNIAAAPIQFETNNTSRWNIDGAGDLLPNTNGAYDLGSNSIRINVFWANYVNVTNRIYVGEFSILDNGTQIRLHNTSGDMFIYPYTGELCLGANGSTRYTVTSNGFIPGTSSIYDLGALSYRFDVVYCEELNEVSDENKKEEIGESLGLDFILNLAPKSYKSKHGKNRKRKHGLIAQNVADVLTSLNLTIDDFSGIRRDEVAVKQEDGSTITEEHWSMSYSQFIGPIINAIKELNDKIKKQ